MKALVLQVRQSTVPNGQIVHSVSWNSYAEFLLVMRYAGKVIREHILNHSPVLSVYLGPKLEDYRDWLEKTPTFALVKDFKELARYDQFSARGDVFLRLTEVWRINDHLKASLHLPLLVNNDNLDHFAWSIWLTNQHVDYFSNFKR